MKKLKLNDLKVNSFVVNKKQVRGGVDVPTTLVYTNNNCQKTEGPTCPLSREECWVSECPTSCCDPSEAYRTCPPPADDVISVLGPG